MAAIGPVELVLRLAIHILALVALHVADGLRRLSGQYASGYAVLPDAYAVGDAVDAGDGALAVARDPVFLPPQAFGNVARVHHVTGIRSKASDRGRVWSARRAVVHEILPPWVLFGPAGEGALAVLEAAASTPADVIERCPPAPKPVDLRWLVATDPWRVALLRRINTAAVAWLAHRPATDDAEEADHGVDAGQPASERLPAQPQDARGGTARQTFVERTRRAAFASALVDELSRDWRVALADPWFAAVGYQPQSWAGVDGGVARQVARRVRRPPAALIRSIDAHPNAALAGTLVALLVLSLWNLAAGALFLLGVLAAASAAAIATSVRRARTRRRRWAPGGFDSDGPASTPSSVQRAMQHLGDPPDPLVVIRLQSLLARATLLVAMRTPEPADVGRWLDWQRRAGYSLPLGSVRAPDGTLTVFAWTSRQAVRRAPRNIRPPWVCPMGMAELAGLAIEAGASRVAIDLGSEASVTIEGGGLEQFLAPVVARETAEIAPAPV